MRTDRRWRCITVVDKNFKRETLFEEDTIRSVNDVVQYEDDPDDDPVEIDTAKILLPERVKASELALHYLEQWLADSTD